MNVIPAALGSSNNIGNNNDPLYYDINNISAQLYPYFDQIITNILLSHYIDSNGDGGGENKIGSPSSFHILERLLFYNNLTEKFIREKVVEAQSVQINQFDAEKSIGGDGINANCGPTSLIMGLLALDPRSGVNSHYSRISHAIDTARYVMVTDPSKDGVDNHGLRNEQEHNTFTNLDEIIRGALAFGAQATKIIPSATDISEALDRGAKVIISGSFIGKQPLPWTGDRGIDDNAPPGGATHHIVLVSGYDPKHGFIVNDPARSAPLYVDGANLEYFMSGNAGAVAISR